MQLSEHERWEAWRREDMRREAEWRRDLEHREELRDDLQDRRMDRMEDRLDRRDDRQDDRWDDRHDNPGRGNGGHPPSYDDYDRGRGRGR